jgi:hypothetical protein
VLLARDSGVFSPAQPGKYVCVDVLRAVMIKCFIYAPRRENDNISAALNWLALRVMNYDDVN